MRLVKKGHKVKVETFEMSDDELRRQRFKYAVVALVMAIVAVSVCMVSVSAAFAISDADTRSRSYISSIWECTQNGVELDAAMEGSGFSAWRGGDVPDWFEDEVASLSNAVCVYATADGSLVFLALDGSAAFEDLQSGLLMRGWYECDMGSCNARTYVKEGGMCRWLMMEDTQREGTVNVVMHIERI